jgi:prepilin-type N-terminal cleavage/methylation domain-containing protein
MKMKIGSHKSSRRNGFTLLELALVITIISLLVVGVLTGQSLIKSSQLQNVVKEINEYDTAVKLFRGKFNYYPGDLNNASSYWGTYTAGASITGASNGNGNWQILSTTTEALYAWRHLALAGFIPGAYTGATATPTYGIGVNIPGSQYSTVATYFLLHGTNQFQSNGNLLILGSIDAVGPWSGAAMPQFDAQSVDAKIDDGNAGTGNLYALDSGTLTSGACSGPHTGAPANYTNLSSATVSCRLFWWLDKNR